MLLLIDLIISSSQQYVAHVYKTLTYIPAFIETFKLIYINVFRFDGSLLLLWFDVLCFMLYAHSLSRKACNNNIVFAECQRFTFIFII